jgi:hypothetical protein
MHGIKDGSVTSAPTEIAVKEALDLFMGRIGIGAQYPIHAHHEARRAKAALGSVIFGYASLDGIALCVVSDTFGRGDNRSVQGAERPQTRVYWPFDDVARCRVHPCHVYRARAAAAFSATQFRPRETYFRTPQELN